MYKELYKRTCSVFSIFALIHLPLCAQEIWAKGSIVTNTGEKKIGFIEYLPGNQLNSFCHFKSTETASVEQFKAGSIQQYFFDHAKFATKTFQQAEDLNTSVFAECLFESEKYALFRYKRQYIIEDKIANSAPFKFGFKPGNESNPAQKQDNARLLALTQSLLTEMGIPVEKLSNTLPTVEKLKKIMVDYHQSKAIPFHVYGDERAEMKLVFGWVEFAHGQELGAKISASDVFDPGNIPTASSYGISIPIQFSQHPSYGPLSLMVLPGLRKVKYGFEQTQLFRTYNFEYEANYLQSGFLLKYNLLPARQKIQLGLYAGPNLRGLLSDAAKITERYQNINNRDTTLTRGVLSLSGNLNVDALLGFDLGINTKNAGQFYLGARAQLTPFKRNFIFGTNERNFTIQSIPLNLFLGFRPQIKPGLGRAKKSTSLK